ncbi:DEAD/DEAH box helicase [Aspergillus vadensis CBS 113365]|uniref:Uncharacterized protein n=1 Tax=Aspergillus vadensis (strain CBS 113365 / IMI 142717 / IBT 24658) TaxID=1448311 RepID=A0A319BRI6_ASPVC|nr:hypothetical protein BO88DRAFT_428609 [Aspergillus vadensis CBS 113365]PYH65798.1 hypothetical protein BO88DRAFT_428609 [Aspergillus vadensis CBS 113365]
MNNLKRCWDPVQDVAMDSFTPCKKAPKLTPPDHVDYLEIPSETDHAPLTPEGCVQNNEVVCYGALYEGRVSRRGKKILFQKFCRSAGSLERFLVLRKHEGCFIIQDQALNQFAVLDTVTAAALDGLEGLENIIFQAVPQPLIGNQPSTGETINVSINIYGPMRHYREVGSRLSKLKYNLQHPDAIDSGVRYDNPQYFKRSFTHLDMHQFIRPVYHVKRSLQSVSSEVERLLDTLDAVVPESDIPATEKLLTPLLDGLLIHLSDLPSDRSKQSTGGIIADTMGLGKTLTMLSAIVLSLEKATDFMQYTGRCLEGDHCAIPTKTTLVIVPSTRIIKELFDVWISEMERHIAPNSMHLSIFHGHQKKLDVKEYLASDVVLTTYATLASDSHWIRTPASKQFRAVTQLQACHRWCLTGTPIQNKLEDLGSLVSFLRIPPFEIRSQAKFKEYIIDPLFSGGNDPSQNLRLLLRSLCLRRTKQGGHSITVNTVVVKLLLSAAERTAYDEILNETKHEMDTLVSSNLGARKYTKLFTAMHRLRVLCVQGTACRSWNSRSCSPTRPSGIKNSEPRCEICDDEFTTSFKAECLFCPGCSRLLSDIVFSAWTKTLDILCMKMEELGLNYVRIDGDVSRLDRTRRLHDFRTSSLITILLMTYGTGAVGLNLTAANRIHILEPQWNPSVEEQAIGRAVRLGQSREVTVVKYVAQRTVEEVLQIQVMA